MIYCSRAFHTYEPVIGKLDHRLLSDMYGSRSEIRSVKARGIMLSVPDPLTDVAQWQDAERCCSVQTCVDEDSELELDALWGFSSEFHAGTE